ncbi:MAG: ribosome recycling factor [Myxococcota bacterium]|jgi:ribosome recycling factor|nr:ribosome recycling factor [Myxococcota bacterium]
MSAIDDVYAELKGQIDATLNALKGDLGKMRTGRANAAILDGVRVDYFGSMSPLNQVANVNVADARLITVKPWDKSIIAEVEKAIMGAEIGITPQNDGEMIRLPIPALTEERRKELAKQVKQRAEDSRISLRNHRRDANDFLKELEKEKEISQDDLKKALEKVQQVTDAGNKSIDEIIAKKENELLDF